MKKLYHRAAFYSEKSFKKLLQIMKLSTLLIIVSTVWVSATEVRSQGARVNLNTSGKSLAETLTSIEKQTSYLFFYNQKEINVDQPVNLSVTNAPVSEVLATIFEGTDVNYVMVKDYIVLSKKEIKNEGSILQKQKVSGLVKDANSGEPIIGANIVVEGTTMGVVTDIDGKFSIELPNENSVLTVSYIGYVSQRVTPGGQANIEVKLVSDVTNLEEIVVVGYGTQKKSDVTGSVVSVSSKEITSRPVNNVIEAMQGKAAGVDITTSQRPGTLGTINIRGSRSLTASNDPLYVVDGIPLLSSSGVETINPQDIESIEVLKDASATAIYGSRGANGVILVTTKRGTAGKLSINYSGSLTSQEMVWRSDYMNVGEYIDFIRWGEYNNKPANFTPGDQPSLANDNNIALFKADPVAWANIQKGWANGTWDPSLVETFDWIGEVTQPNIAHEHTISASGGTENMTAYASLGYLNHQGTIKGQEYDRYTFKVSTDLSLKKWIKFGASINASYEDQDFGQANIGGSMTGFANDLVGSAAKIYPYALPYDDNGNRVQYPGGQSRVASVINEWDYSTNQRETLRILGTLFTEINLFKGLKYRLNFGPDYRNYRNGIYNDGKSVVRGGSSYARYDNRKDFSWTLDNLLYYDKTIGDHRFGATFLQTASQYKYEGYAMDAQGIATDTEQWYAFETVPALNSWSSDLTEKTLTSYMGRLNYSLKDKYLLTVSGRWDGASQLANDHKWAFFPSLALGWRMDQENFMKNIEWVNQLKLRLGYGATGNAAVQPYTTLGEINSLQTPFGGDVVTGYVTTDNYSNKLLGWEKTTQYNLGFDIGVFKNRINGTIDVYASNTTDLLMTAYVPTITGYSKFLANVGETKNKGFEVSVNTVNVKVADFNWESRISAAWQKDEIVNLLNGKEDMVSDTLFIGESIKSFYDYKRVGLWQDTPEDQAEMALFNANGHQFQPGMVRVEDQNGDHKITANDDRVIIGNRNPRWTVGIGNTFTYKNWQLSIFISGRLKYLANVGEGLTGMYGDQRSVDYWTPTNTGAEYQKPFRNEAGGDSYAGTYYKDNSFLKIRNISLSYQLPKNLLSKINIESARVYVQSRNTGMLWSNIKFRDAEFGTMYYDRGWVFGIDLGF
jgi:TonB-linked SusC/RagA family outer membrane protein